MRRIAALSVVLLAVVAVAGTPASAGMKSYTANMSGDQEKAGGDPDGKGTATVETDADAGQVCYTLTHNNIGTPDKAHIHRGAMKENGPPVVNLDPTKSGRQCTAGDKAVLKEIESNPGGFYVNVHNAEYKDGAIRGQLGQSASSGGRGGSGGY